MHHPNDLSDPVPWRRSLRASQQRRAAAALRRRRGTRSRGAAAAALAGLTIVASGALAAPAASPPAKSAATQGAVEAAQGKLGIAADGIAGPQTRRAVRSFQRANALSVDGVLGPETLAKLGVQAGSAPASTADASAASSADATPLLAAIARCESGGDPTAVSSDGEYHGKYQFLRSTWRGLGGSGDPAKAPEAEQDRRAAALMKTQGPGAWPNCSKQAGG